MIDDMEDEFAAAEARDIKWKRRFRLDTRGLIPCPFCHGTARVQAARLGRGGFEVCCLNTGGANPNACAVQPRTLPMVSRAAARRAWNQRGRS